MGDMSEYYGRDSGDYLGRQFFVKPPVDFTKTWTSESGGRVEISKMTDAHLHYALAKAYRGEYQDTHNRKVGIDALKAEAVRRLAPAAAGTSIGEVELRDLRQKLCEARRDATQERDRRTEQGLTNKRLFEENTRLKNAPAADISEGVDRAYKNGVEYGRYKLAEELRLLWAEQGDIEDKVDALLDSPNSSSASKSILPKAVDFVIR